MGRLTLAALLLVAGAASAAEPVRRTPPGEAMASANSACRRLQASAAANPERLTLKRLADLPPGALQRAVLRRIGGCPVLEVKLDGRFVYVPSVRDVQPRRDLGRQAR
jgi:hypothetical protein